MATWADLEGLTWDELETFSWDQIEGLSRDQISHYVSDLWPYLIDLSQSERRELGERVIAGTLPVLVAGGQTSGASAK